jgi:Anti-sigma factor NepR
MQARQGYILTSGKSIPSDLRTSARNPAPGAAADKDGANRAVRNAALQQGLRAAYRTVVEEPLPDRLLALLQQLDGDGPKR